MRYIVCGDLGTSGIKIGLVNERGEVVDSVYRSTHYETRGAGRMIQNAEFFVEESLQCIRLLLTRTGIPVQDVVSLSLSGQMGGIIGVDDQFNNLTGLDMGLDIQSERYNRFFQSQYTEFVNLKSCGSPRNFPKILRWKKEHPALFNQITRFVPLSGYVTGRIAGLRGEDAFVDYTLLSFFGNEEMIEKRWSADISHDLAIPLQKLPRIVAPWDIVGKLSPWASARCGLLAGTPLVAGLGDQPAGFLGGNFCTPDRLVDVAGSSTILSTFVREPVFQREKPAVMYMISALPEGYHAFSYINGGGFTIRWFINEVVGETGANQDECCQLLTEKSARLPAGSEGLLFLPYFAGRQCPYDNTIRGAFIGISWWHRREHFFRAILESLAYDYALGFKALRRSFPNHSFNTIHVTGGGAKNHLWNEIKSSVLHRPFLPVDDYKYPLLGCALIGGFGVGLFPNLTVFADRERDTENRLITGPPLPVYDQYLKIYENLLHSALEKSFHDLSALVEPGV